MKEKILQVLKEKVGKTSLSDKTVSDYVAGIATFVTDESQLTDQFYTAHVNIIKSMDGNFSHDVAAQVEEAKKNLSNPQTPPTTPPAEEKPQWAKDFETQMKTFIESQQSAIKQAQRTQLLESVKKTALTKDAANEKSGWASNAGVLDMAVQLIQIEDADTEETIFQKCQAEYNKRYVETFGKSDSVPGVGGGGVAVSAEERQKAIQANAEKTKDMNV